MIWLLIAGLVLIVFQTIILLSIAGRLDQFAKSIEGHLAAQMMDEINQGSPTERIFGRMGE